MLVLSRREKEKIRFPSLGICLEVLRVRGKSTRIGIDAPPDIPVVRDELTDLKGVDFTPDHAANDAKLMLLADAIRERLEKASEELCQLHQLLEQSDCAKAEQHVLAIHRQLRALEKATDAAMENSPYDSSINALVVEDNVAERQLMEAYLQVHHVNVTTATDGQDALDHLSMHAAPDVILLDMEMPRCDGPTFVQQVRSRPELGSVKIFAVSGFEPADLRVPLDESTLDGWFVKPIDPEQVVSEVIAQVSQPVTVA